MRTVTYLVIICAVISLVGCFSSEKSSSANNKPTSPINIIAVDHQQITAWPIWALSAGAVASFIASFLVVGPLRNLGILSAAFCIGMIVMMLTIVRFASIIAILGLVGVVLLIVYIVYHKFHLDRDLMRLLTDFANRIDKDTVKTAVKQQRKQTQRILSTFLSQAENDDVGV